ncbi:DUF7281 domain-containing protein [Rheinheimera sp. UJ63]|uniref:DUF7281 domain-containing protein n=1 Tax=Rheinheimera sp. UJ63 TaxID=2910157 RepID=UPI001F3B7EBB|nr:Wadjet anti-phage system protein JetD domain-containing protein [Rheinheimera sp. UJ63]MCF4008704.1 DUF2220 domain-containing protein [Rheinheimera sp. UJ63]
MQAALGLQALNWLAQLEQRLKRDGQVAISSKGKVARQVIAWCIEQQLLPSHSANLPVVQFNLALLAHIAEAQLQLQQVCFRAKVSEQDRLQQAEYANQELKSAGASPRQTRVLLRLNTAISQAGLTIATVDLDWRELQLGDYDALVIVENLDCFYQLTRFRLHHRYPNPLVIYRGDSHYSSGGKALNDAWQHTGKPSLYFGDADLAGLAIAFSLHCQSILLPEFAQFKQCASVDMQADQQLKYQDQLLRAEVHPAFKPYQQLICQQLKGLRQQQMQGLALYAINLR